ncbi:MAG: CbiX/SirB N-terminal domain-containing protein [Verrucomicrobiota bacterium]
MALADAALLLLGHGSTLNADSSAPTYQHAEELRRRGIFAEVHVGFWKEEPNFRQALRQTACRSVYVVPNFISSGYFTEQIIPRELGLNGPITRVGEQDVYYCQPVGLSPVITDVLLKRAREVVAASGAPCDPAKTCLFICGHGTSLNDNSTKIIHEQVEIIRARGLYADCQGVLMEQRPFVKDWRTLTDCPNVIVVPFFISDGLHSYEDIPVLLGLTHNMREKAFTNPHREGARWLWYATAIGTESSIADVVLDLVTQFDAEHFGSINFGPQKRDLAIYQSLMSCVVEMLAGSVTLYGTEIWTDPYQIGQVLILFTLEGQLEVRHFEDAKESGTDLRPLKSLADLRDLILRASDGSFRPLRAAPNLQRGWTMTVGNTNDLHALQEIIDYLYPAALANWALWKDGKLPVTPWRETAERQSGRFRIVRELGDEGARELAAEVCDRGCLKRRLWAPCAQTVEPGPQEIPLLCPEACNYFVGKAREKLKGPEEEP